MIQKARGEEGLARDLFFFLEGKKRRDGWRWGKGVGKEGGEIDI